jgi:hypothetical protein
MRLNKRSQALSHSDTDADDLLDYSQAAKMLQLGAKVLDNVRMGAKPIPKAKTAAPPGGPPRDASQQDKQSEQERKLVSEPR